MQCLPICTLGFLFLRRTWLPACAGVRYWPRHLPSCCWSGRATRASDGLIWPKDGYASIAYAATAPMRLSSPGLRPFLARQQSLSAAVLRCAPARRRVRRRSPSGRSTAEDGGGETLLSREEWAKPRGRKSHGAVGHGRWRIDVLWPDRAIRGPRRPPAPTALGR